MRTYQDIFEKIPKTEVIVKDILSCPRASNLCGASEHIMSTPDVFNGLTIGHACAVCKVEQVLFMRFLLVRRVVELRDERAKVETRAELKVRWPVNHVNKQIN